jgi:hypothetical protein
MTSSPDCIMYLLWTASIETPDTLLQSALEQNIKLIQVSG